MKTNATLRHTLIPAAALATPETGLSAGLRRGTVEKLQSLLDSHTGNKPLADFFRWACSERNPQRAAWLDLSGIEAQSRLVCALLDGMGDPGQSEQMMLHALPMAACQVLEELTEKVTGPCAAALAAAANRATIQCLAGEKYRAADLLKAVEPLASETSLFSASRDAARFRTIAEMYVRETGQSSVEAIDRSLWCLLVAKAESCHLAAYSVRQRWLGSMVTQGLMDRFRRGGAVMADGSVPLSRRLMAGAESSRSVPVLAFFVAMLEPVLRFETLTALTSDTAFAEALNVAAMLVRLLKDMGTPLLTNDWVRSQFARLLDQKTVDRDGADLASVLNEEAGPWGDWTARLASDVTRGETNICLTGLLNLPLPVGIPRLCDRIDYLAGIFANARKYLERLAQDVTVQVWSAVPATLILRFVEFYERLYAGTPIPVTTQVCRRPVQ